MKTMLRVLLATGLAAAALAQAVAPSDDVLRAQKKLQVQLDETKKNVIFNSQTFEFVSGQLISGPPVKGAPYSAEAVNETIQMLADGNRIVQRTTAMQYRDAEGRERREETSAMGAVGGKGSVSGVPVYCEPQRCRQRFRVFKQRVSQAQRCSFTNGVGQSDRLDHAECGKRELEVRDRVAQHAHEAGLDEKFN